MFRPKPVVQRTHLPNLTLSIPRVSLRGVTVCCSVFKKAGERQDRKASDKSVLSSRKTVDTSYFYRFLPTLYWPFRIDGSGTACNKYESFKNEK